MPNDLDRASLKSAAAANKSLCCIVPECESKRHGLGHYCGAHVTRRHRLGNPKAPNLKPEQYAEETESIHELLALNAGHKAIDAGCQVIAGLLELALATPLYEEEKRMPGLAFLISPSIPAHFELRRIANQATPPLEILIEVLAVYMYFAAGRAGDFGKDHGTVFARLLGTRFIYIRPRSRRAVPNGRDRERLGKWCLENLGPLLANFAGTAEKRRARLIGYKDTMRTPLNITDKGEPDGKPRTS